MPNPLANFSNLQQRVISGLFLAAIVLAATYTGGIAFRLLAVAIGAGIYTEWRAITATTKTSWARIGEFGLIVIFALILANLPALIIFAAIAATISCCSVLVLIGKAKFWLPLGIAYSTVPVASMSLLRGDSASGLAAIVFVLSIVWATDIFAYFVGKSVGGAKLAPNISPNKTWSGAIGGAAAGVVAGIAAASMSGPLGNPILPIACLFISVFSQLGDLFESWLKRRFGIKDSGNLIPGHGGVMDRVDGLVVAVTTLYLINTIGTYF